MSTPPLLFATCFYLLSSHLWTLLPPWSGSFVVVVTRARHHQVCPPRYSRRSSLLLKNSSRRACRSPSTLKASSSLPRFLLCHQDLRGILSRYCKPLKPSRPQISR
ncbi:hypothetical protein C8F04DRAFT_1060330 [Mycena alexandri]|uniref:Secreted protein n=1 Tax=Mycena alexandri TaxID=1745969 RepID=A0AAD6XH46_9AGAR|nr:hypothetical protein C8F04DRAFT_1060330 [Mycena alexandri]